jgi:hypothetical protein
MSHAEELGSTHPRRAEAAVATDTGRKSLDWAILVVTLAFSCTLAWIYFLLWGAVRVLQVVIS